jgi:hypothetical protein
MKHYVAIAIAIVLFVACVSAAGNGTDPSLAQAVFYVR